jgi:hypothetical protein
MTAVPSRPCEVPEARLVKSHRVVAEGTTG